MAEDWEYRLNRIAPNTERWNRPCAGRLGMDGVGEYVKKHGFGHEDWNFNFDFKDDNGDMYGYTSAKQANELIGRKFGLVLGVINDGRWYAVGCYDGATLLEGGQAPLPDLIVDQMAVDVFELAQKVETDPVYRKKTLRSIRRIIEEDYKYFNWKVSSESVVIFDKPKLISDKIINTRAVRFMTSHRLSKGQYKEITGGGSAENERVADDGYEEGDRKLRLHVRSERSRGLVDQFKRSLESFSCTVCGFNFEEVYGDLGEGFIECHHKKPIAQMRPGDKTKVNDLCAVCANCHRMLHHGEELISVEELRRLMENAK